MTCTCYVMFIFYIKSGVGFKVNFVIGIVVQLRNYGVWYRQDGPFFFYLKRDSKWFLIKLIDSATEKTIEYLWKNIEKRVKKKRGQLTSGGTIAFSRVIKAKWEEEIMMNLREYCLFREMNYVAWLMCRIQGEGRLVLKESKDHFRIGLIC